MSEIVNLRRHMVMEQGQFPGQLQNAFKGLETVGNVYTFANEQRADWAEGLGVRPFSEGMERGLSPEVSPRMRGVIEKCSFCHHRLMRAKERVYMEGKGEIEEGAYITACAEACPAQAITFGDLNNPKHKVSELIKSRRAFRLLEKLQTKPKVYYLSSKDWVHKLGDNYLPGQFKPVSKAMG